MSTKISGFPVATNQLRKRDETQRQDLVLSFGSGAYMLRYMLEDKDTVVVIRVWHSQEDRR
jgi:hypothetical protein